MMPAAYAELDLGALEHNLAKLRAQAPGAKLMAVVKANAYGHGLVRVATHLPDVDAFAVARVEEGVRLREAGVRQRIAVLEGFVCAEELALEAHNGLEPLIHSGWQIDLLEEAELDTPVGVWAKVDTGMHRLGLDLAEFASCYRRLQNCSIVRQPVPVVTHLANADVLSDEVTPQQLERFRHIAEDASERSVANSAGLLGWKSSHTEWVRPGIALYGVSPFADRTGPDEGLRPVMTLKTRLIAIKPVPAGAAVGYGGEWICPRPTRMGIAAIGYGDGYPRHAGSGTPVLVRGQRVPLIGRVSMDMINLDLTDCPESAVGDAVTLWGEGLPVEEIARHAATIPYVLLCNVTQRVRMVERPLVAR